MIRVRMGLLGAVIVATSGCASGGVEARDAGGFGGGFIDAGLPSDGGTPPDAGPPLDGGAPPDGGPRDGGGGCVVRDCDSLGIECGPADDGCGRPLACGTCPSGTCSAAGRCETASCAPDAREPNDTSAVATYLGAYDNADSPPDGVFADQNLDDAADVDWLRFEINDDDLDNPTITVRLDQIPAGSTYQLSAFYDCGDGSDWSECGAGSVDDEIGNGCTAAATTSTASVSIDADCDRLFSSDDSGTLLVRVRATVRGAACTPHRVTVSVD